ncbi:nucleotidyltransferase family protein [Phenylobacterium montanum]|uniref:Nucleotidyltransferase domain-containing protein n=1 Tax=Phenylobacterium montanum TaxID=2823693 RepID=A0A975G4N5_9CAUL|nr:nucleotidyltransferase domain-containing protein [Caulobacter sp. S6]QUD90576.1 nucleotidyltransferase domain-containing protein [Caulobacter sp. S6]
MTADQAAQLTNALTIWATEQPSVRALAIVGSWARAAARPDSDLDVIVLADPTERWTMAGEWLSPFGDRFAGDASAPGREVYGNAVS